MSTPIDYVLALPAERDPLPVIARLLERAGSVLDRIRVQVMVFDAGAVATWRGRLQESYDEDFEEEGISVYGLIAPAEVEAILAEVGDVAFELRWDVEFWRDAEGNSCTPHADNYLYLRFNAEEHVSCPAPGTRELVITVNSRALDPDCAQVAESLARHVGMSLG